jgi:hypothetical protein
LPTEEDAPPLSNLSNPAGRDERDASLVQNVTGVAATSAKKGMLLRRGLSNRCLAWKYSAQWMPANRAVKHIKAKCTGRRRSKLKRHQNAIMPMKMPSAACSRTKLAVSAV